MFCILKAPTTKLIKFRGFFPFFFFYSVCWSDDSDSILSARDFEKTNEHIHDLLNFREKLKRKKSSSVEKNPSHSIARSSRHRKLLDHNHGLQITLENINGNGQQNSS